VLEFRVLGELEVLRDGAPLALPPSRKTRALLAYLALTRRAHRRERLCEIFWDVPDDPRGALRWSLSKIRPVIDDPAHPRLIADRNSVELRTESLGIDLLAAQACVRVSAGPRRHATWRRPPLPSALRYWPISTCRQTANSTAGC
jgi:DNA-binding SARP family transcriptional activator